MKKSTSHFQNWKATRREFFKWALAAFGAGVAVPRFLEAVGFSIANSSPAESAVVSVESSPLTYPGKGVTLHGYLSKPLGGGAHPAVVILHGDHGLTENIRQVGIRLSSEGYVTLCVDLLSRLGGTYSFAESNEASKAIDRLKEDYVYDDLDAAFEFLASNASVKKDKVALLGFSWGADRVFQYAAVDEKPKAAIVLDPEAPSEVLIQHLSCPVLGLYGAVGNPAASTAATTEAKMKKSGKLFEAKVYPGVAQGFFEGNDKEIYAAAASKDAWGRVLEFLKVNLK